MVKDGISSLFLRAFETHHLHLQDVATAIVDAVAQILRDSTTYSEV